MGVAMGVAVLGWWTIKLTVDVTIPVVLTWALGWICEELQSPKESIVERFTKRQIDGFAYTSREFDHTVVRRGLRCPTA